MSLTGIMLDVSHSMQNKIVSGTGEQGEPWAQCIFEVIDDLVEYDVSSENRVFAIGIGANCPRKEIFDVIGTVKRITEIMQTPATTDHVNKILDILEKNGARNIRKWARDVPLIQAIVPDYTATVILWNLESDGDFLWKFVHEFLPHSVQDSEPKASDVEPDLSRRKPGPFTRRADSFYASFASRFRPAKRQDIEEIVEKAKSYIIENGKWIRLKYDSVEDSFRILKEGDTHSIFSWNWKHASGIVKDVGTHSIFSVQDASCFTRGCVGKKELSTQRKQELLENVKPFIVYGLTPLYESLEKAIELFEGDTSKYKLLFVLSDGEPTDGRKGDVSKINQITSKLREAGVKIVSCFISGSTDIHPKRLHDKMSPDWEPGAKFLFSLSSKVRTQDLVARAILVKRGWTIDVANNETKLFMQVNHPDNLREACEVARNVVCSSDALSELLVSVDLDIYIHQTTSGFTAKDQGKDSTCYAFASATVLHLAMQRFHGREEGCPSFDELKDEMINACGRKGADTRKVLEKMCQKHNLCCRQVSVEEAKEAIVAKRPVVARFRLTHKQWKAFDNFYENNPTGILTKKDLGLPDTSKPEGHAVVLMSYNSKCLFFMDSCGPNWPKIAAEQGKTSEKGLNGIFKVENADVLPTLEFFDVFWDLDKLTERQKEYYQRHKSEVAERLRKLLKGLQKAEYTCPECKKTSLVTEFTGTLSKVQCPKCSSKFSTNDNTGNILALNIYLTTLSE